MIGDVGPNGDGGQVEKPDALTEEQLADIATLLGREIPAGNLEALAESVVGREALKPAANDRDDRQAYARRVVQILHESGKFEQAVFQLRTQAAPTSRLIFALNRVVQGERLDDDTAYQSFINDNQPFMSSDRFLDFFPRVARATCLVGLEVAGEPAIWGSGFLVGPDLVMTNYHVVARFITKDAAGKFTQLGLGKKLYCFFDYLSAPSPRLPLVMGGDERSGIIAVRAADDWLVCASESLKFDGTDKSPEVADENLDYVIIKLDRAVGALPTRRSGGEARGWLNLLDVRQMALGDEPRLMLLGHPASEPQQFDFGTFRRIDPTATRIWYKLSAAKGSSGGPAVDVDGKLVALHNAEVQRTGEALPLQQGVRLDRIVPRLTSADSGVVLAASPLAIAPLFWSLSDDLSDPQPIVGREPFVTFVGKMMKSDGARVLVVSGPEGSGRKFSVGLLRRALGPAIPVATFGPTALQQFAPEVFVRAIAEQLAITGLAAHPVPPPKSAEDIPRWLRIDLPLWLTERLTDDARRDKSRYPAWVVIDTTLPANEAWTWAANLKDCIAALVGVPEPGQRVIDIPQLRWLFLGYSPDGFPIGSVTRNEEFLGKDPTYEKDFADCLGEAWRSLKQGTDQIPRVVSEGIAREKLAQRGMIPPRKILADYARTLYLGIRERIPQ